MSRVARYGVAVALITAGVSPIAASAHAAQRWVIGPSQSIQATVDRAHSGDTIVLRPGVYRQNVNISKDRITLLGSGAAAAGTVLEPPAHATPSTCERVYGPAGICIAGRIGKYPAVQRYVTGVTIRGILVRHFDIGIFAVGARDPWFDNNATMHTEDYGLARFASTGGGMRANRASGAGEFGLYVGDSPNANAKVFGNTSTASTGGIFLRNVRHVEASFNTFTNNCAGMSLAGEPNGSLLNIHHNTIRGNNRVCDDGSGDPPLAGIGIIAFGIQDSAIRANHILNNRAASPVSSGLYLVDFGKPASGNVIEGNVAFGNAKDIRVDPDITDNVFRGNSCATSQPAWICG